MIRLVRLARGVVLTAVTWGIAWIPMSLVLIAISPLLGQKIPGRAFLAVWLVRQATAGMLNGAVFATVLAIAGRRRIFANLSTARIAVYGAVGGAFCPVLISIGIRMDQTRFFHIPTTLLVLSVALSSVMGAVWASASLRLARRAPELPRSGAPPVDATIGSGATPVRAG